MDGGDYHNWLTELAEDVIEDEFGYDPGEFAVYSGHWWELYNAGLTPREAWLRALDGHVNGPEDSGLARIVSEDEAKVARSQQDERLLNITGYYDDGSPY
jgi:hypothetical protein